MKNPKKIYDLVVMNHEPAATMYRIKAATLEAVGVIDATIEDIQPDQRIQWVHISLVLRPTYGQLAEFERLRYAADVQIKRTID